MKKLSSIFVFALPVVVAAVAIGSMARQAAQPEPDVLTGIVETTEIDVVPKIPGRVGSVLVREGDRVAAGQVLVTLESREIDAKVEQARGALQAADAKRQMARNGARPQEREAAERLYRQAQHQFDLAEKTYNRIQRVFEEGVVAEQERDQARFRYDAAREQMEAAHAQYRMALEGARPEDRAAAEGLVHQAESALAEALAYQSETHLVAPVAGEVVERVMDPGEVVAAGYPVLTLIDPTDVWVVLQVREDQLGGLKVGATVEGVVAGLEQTAHRFRVARVAPMADFATWRATNQRGDFDLKTFEVELRPVSPIAGLRPGMTVRVTR